MARSLWAPLAAVDTQLWSDLDRQFQQAFQHAFPRGENGNSTWAPAFDVLESRDAYTVRADVPGLNAEAVKVTFEKDTLKIEGERSLPAFPEGEELRTHVSERTYGTFSRQLRFPVALNTAEISAEVKDGVLTIRLPKAPEAQARTIQIQTK